MESYILVLALILMAVALIFSIGYNYILFADNKKLSATVQQQNDELRIERELLRKIGEENEINAADLDKQSRT